MASPSWRASQGQHRVAGPPYLSRLAAHVRLRAHIESDDDVAVFGAAMHKWLASCDAYDRSFVADQDGTSGEKTSRAAGAKRMSRCDLDSVCQGLGLGPWPHSAEVRRIAREQYDLMAEHASVRPPCLVLARWPAAPPHPAAAHGGC